MKDYRNNIKSVLEHKMQLVRDSKNTKLYLNAVIDYHEYICSSKELTPILCEIIKMDLISAHYLREIFNDFIISHHMKYDFSKDSIYPNFYDKKIENKYKLMENFTKLIKSEYDETKSSKKLYFDTNMPIIKTKRDEEFFYTQKLHNDIIEKLETEQMFEKNMKEKELTFDIENSVLYFLNEAIIISQNVQSSAHDLLKTIFKDKTRIWNTDEVLDDWNYYLSDEKPPKNKVYQSGKAVNRIVAQNTMVKDFLDISTKSISINKKYL